MVSTRGVRYKFSEGERVLCYEPDPTKAKVLYDSKVLEVVESKDKRGRRTVEYLIHFQGWNSSWDRCVSEDFVLKDTEENRQLQRDLAEKSQLQLGAYLYRRERKKGSTNSSSGAAKRPRLGFSDDGSSSSTQPEDAEGGGVSDSSSGSGSGSQPSSPPPQQPGRAHITLPSQLRDRLTFDFHLVVKRGKVSKLPATPSAAEILESFVKWYARAGAWHPTRGRHDPPQKPDMLDVSCRLNLVREVADGLRVYFDFILRGHLLYKQELNQYQDVCGQYIDSSHEELMSKTSQDEAFDSLLADVKQLEPLRDMKSPGMSEYAHLPPFTEDVRNGEKITIKTENQATIFELPKTEVDVKFENKIAKKEDGDSVDAATLTPPVNNINNNVAKVKDVKTVALRAGTVARRLRSHKSVVSQGDNEEPAPSTSAVEPRTFETMSSSFGSSGSSLSESFSRPTQAQAAPATTRTPLSLLLDKVAKWQIIPRDGTEHLPCRVYGAIHLSRLFVKLPEFLNATTMADFKIKLILKHIDMFVQYLDEHSEWFGEGYYLSESITRSH